MNIDLRKTQLQINWLKRKLYLDSISPKSVTRVIKKGQVYFCDLGMGVGSELQKERPCVIMQNDVGNLHSPITTIIPITHTQKNLNCFVQIADKYDKNGNIILDGSANVSGIRSIDKARIGNYICDLEQSELKEIDEAIAKNIDIYKHYVKLKNMYDDKLVYIEKLNIILSEIRDLIDVDDNKKIVDKLKKILDSM